MASSVCTGRSLRVAVSGFTSGAGRSNYLMTRAIDKYSFGWNGSRIRPGRYATHEIKFRIENFMDLHIGLPILLMFIWSAARRSV